MADAIARALSRFSGTQINVEAVKTIAIFSGIGLVASLVLLATYGLDLSGGFF